MRHNLLPERAKERERDQAYYIRTREKRIAAVRKWRAKKKAERLAYNEAHKEEIEVAAAALEAERRQKRLSYNRRYRLAHRDQDRAKTKRWADKHKDRISAANKAYRVADPSRAAARDMLNDARKRAKQKGVPFDITKEDIVIPYLCPYLGIVLERVPHGGGDTSPTLDRVDPDFGYVRGNIEVISHLANRIKSSATAEQILAVGHALLLRKRSIKEV